MTNFFIKIGELLVYLFFFHSIQAQSNLVFNPSLEDTLSYRPIKVHFDSLGDTLLNCNKWYKTDLVHYHNYKKINYRSLKKSQNKSFEGECHVTLSVSNLNSEKWYMNSFITGTLKRKLKKDSLYKITYYFKPATKVAYSFPKLNCHLDSTYILDPFKKYKPVKNISYSIADKKWVRASSTYKANGHEKYITIGYFNTDILTYTKNKKHRKKVKKGLTLIDLIEVTPLYQELINNKTLDSLKTQNESLELFFKHDSFVLSEKCKQEIENRFEKSKQIKKITIYGYASKTGDYNYNLNLSKSRINEVEKYIQSKKLNLTIEKIPFGNEHKLKDNEEKQRKVLIIFE